MTNKVIFFTSILFHIFAGKSSSNSVSCLGDKNMQRSSGNSSGSQNNQPPLDDRDRVVRVGDWSEHISSSGTLWPSKKLNIVHQFVQKECSNVCLKERHSCSV